MHTSEQLQAPALVTPESGAEIPRVFAGRHHARLVEEQTPMHIISRVFQGRFLLRPEPALNELIIGVIGRAQVVFPAVKLHAIAFMSNHLHAIATGPSSELPFFIGFIKREISRRWGGEQSVNWRGGMWEGYVASALPTAASQINALKYVLAQGTKEDLVERPQDWPGVHCVHALMSGRSMSGKWLDATTYGRAKKMQQRKKDPQHVKRSDFLHEYALIFSPIPAWSTLAEAEQRAAATQLVREICEEAAARRRQSGAVILGAERVCAIGRETRSDLPPVPWFELRRHMIAWADPTHPETRDYLYRYWAFQDAFHLASTRFLSGEIDTPFPSYAFRPINLNAPRREPLMAA